MLKVLGVIFLILLAVLAVGIFILVHKAKRGLNRLARTAALAESTQGPEIKLAPCSTLKWQDVEKFERFRQAVTAEGCEPSGQFTIPAMNGVSMATYKLNDLSAYVVIYEHETLGMWTDVWVEFADGSTYTASTAKQFGPGAPRPEKDALEHYPEGTELETLIAATKVRALDKEQANISVEDFQERFERACEEHREFIANQPIEQEWLEAIALDTGVKLDGDEALELQKYREEARNENLYEDCVKAVAASGHYTALEWEQLRDRIVIVHNKLDADDVACMLLDRLGLSDEQYERISEYDTNEHPPRTTVAQFNGLLGKNRSMELICTLSDPIEADVYLGQEDEFWEDADCA